MISPYRATVLNFGFCFGFSCDIDSYVASTDEGQNSRAINKKKIVGPGGFRRLRENDNTRYNIYQELVARNETLCEPPEIRRSANTIDLDKSMSKEINCRR